MDTNDQIVNNNDNGDNDDNNDNGNNNKEESKLWYYKSVDEMFTMMNNNNGVVKLQVYFGKQVGSVVYQHNKPDELSNYFTFFGRRTGKKQQLKMLENDSANELWKEIQKLL